MMLAGIAVQEENNGQDTAGVWIAMYDAAQGIAIHGAEPTTIALQYAIEAWQRDESERVKYGGLQVPSHAEAASLLGRCRNYFGDLPRASPTTGVDPGAECEPHIESVLTFLRSIRDRKYGALSNVDYPVEDAIEAIELIQSLAATAVFKAAPSIEGVGRGGEGPTDGDLLAAAKRSLNWLASYPGRVADGCYDQMRAAIAKTEAAPKPPEDAAALVREIDRHFHETIPGVPVAHRVSEADRLLLGCRTIIAEASGVQFEEIESLKAANAALRDKLAERDA